ncbi:MAG TPA: hypothetical protein VJ788_08665 [Gemmatimonadota bacterium]|nr:hypothetical protein [Gemmatimonadota bacterium]
MRRSITIIRACLPVALFALATPAIAQESAPHLTDLRAHGREPVAFVLDQLEEHDLIVFDDALHTLVEPFAFYQRLVREPAFRQRARFVFLESVPLNQQGHVEAYLAAPDPDPRLLYPAFQNSIGGDGFPYATYFDLLATIHEVNRALPDSERVRVVAVGSPTYWSEIRTPRDLEVFRQGLDAYDYTMYSMIRSTLGSGGKGVFLTNTRHAYQAIRHADGSLYWNATTYFHEREPGRAYSIRFHAPQLVIERMREDTTATRTTQGMERIDYRWDRMEGGAWDRAFRDYGEPVAVPLEGTAFGAAPYVGNHMLDVAAGQTMADAYDAVIFLAPLEELHQTAFVGSIYTPEFRSELARRLAILYGEEDLAAFIAESGASDLAGAIESAYADRPQEPLPQSQDLPPLE